MRRKGQVIVTAVFIMVFLSIIGIAVVSMLSTASFSIFKTLHGIQALNVAEGGIRFTIATSLAADSDWSDNTDFGPISLNPGVFSVRYISTAKKACTFESTGVVNGVSRVVRVSCKKGGLPYQFSEYVIYAGNPSGAGGQVNFYNQSKIVGNFFYFGPITIQGSRPPPCQTLGVIKSTAISPVPAIGIPGYYASWESISTAEPVVWDNTYYDYWLTVANSPAASSITLNGTDNLSLNGGTRWYRNVTMRNNSTITGPGTICATGNPVGGSFTTYDNARIIGPVRIIARGSPTSVRFNDYTSWTNTPEVIALNDLIFDDDVTTPAESILYSRGSGARGIQTKLNAVIRGNVFAPYGRVRNNNDCRIFGLIYANQYASYNQASFEGGAVFYTLADFYNDSTIIQNSAYLPSINPEGISMESGSFEVYDWGEYY